jgi:hypothetical protein
MSFRNVLYLFEKLERKRKRKNLINREKDKVKERTKNNLKFKSKVKNTKSCISILTFILAKIII